MTNKLIQSFDIPDGVRLVAEPFSEPNNNAPCEVISEVKFQGDKRNIRIMISDLKWMKVSDVAILISALRAVVDESQLQTNEPKKKPAKRTKKKAVAKTTKKSTTKKSTTKKSTTKKKPKRTSPTHKKKRIKPR